MMEHFFAIIVMAITLEGIVSYIKMLFVDQRPQWQVISTILVGIFLALAYQLDALALVGVTSIIPFIGQVITGICLSRGSNYIFDWIGKISHIEYSQEAAKDE